MDLNKEGKWIEDEYILGENIGVGGYGEVFEALEREAGNVWAIKRIWRWTRFIKERFAEEA